LGSRRLAILDLSPDGHMPMSDPQRTLWITYNGEIYNFRELRQELTAKGHRFVSESDTEVGKVMGLAPYGKDTYCEQVREIIQLNVLNARIKHREWFRPFAPWCLQVRFYASVDSHFSKRMREMGHPRQISVRSLTVKTTSLEITD
jgi:hypothetical protein